MMMNGDTHLLETLVKQHAAHLLEFNNLRSRLDEYIYIN